MGSPKKSDIIDELKKSESMSKSNNIRSNLFIVLRYSDWVDIVLMILGTVGAIGDGMSTNILLVYASRIMNSLGYGNTQQNRGNFMDEVEKVNFKQFQFRSLLYISNTLFVCVCVCVWKQCSLNFVYLGLAVLVVVFMGKALYKLYTHTLFIFLFPFYVVIK